MTKLFLNSFRSDSLQYEIFYFECYIKENSKKSPMIQIFSFFLLLFTECGKITIELSRKPTMIIDVKNVKYDRNLQNLKFKVELYEDQKILIKEKINEFNKKFELKYRVGIRDEQKNMNYGELESFDSVKFFEDEKNIDCVAVKDLKEPMIIQIVIVEDSKNEIFSLGPAYTLKTFGLVHIR